MTHQTKAFLKDMQKSSSNCMSLTSIVCPVFNEKECLEELTNRIAAVFHNKNYEIILVDDGSEDGSWAEIQRLRATNLNIKGLRFSRNFGHHIALSAGLDWASGDWIIVMDSDLQDLPESIPSLLSKAEEGFDVVVAKRTAKQHGLIKKTCSYFFSKFLTWASGIEFDSSVGVFRVFNQKVAHAIRGMKEESCFFTAMADWVGFKRSTVEVQHGPRFSGETKYSFYKQFSLAMRAILSFSEKPLQIIALGGAFISVVGLLYAVVIVCRAMLGSISVVGYASLMSTLLVVSGLTIATIGVVGLYVGRIFTQVKSRPLYILTSAEGIPEAGVLPPTD